MGICCELAGAFCEVKAGERSLTLRDVFFSEARFKAAFGFFATFFVAGAFAVGFAGMAMPGMSMCCADAGADIMANADAPAATIVRANGMTSVPA